MATVIASLSSDREMGISILSAQQVQAASVDYGFEIAQPASYGDCLIYEAWGILGTIGTPVANPENRGLMANVVSAAQDIIVDWIAGGLPTRWIRITAGAYRCMLQPDVPVLWRMNELVHLNAAFEDTTGTPTLQFVMKVRRLRGPGPLFLGPAVPAP